MRKRKQGCGMIFFSRNPRLVLVYRRDDIAGIPAPGLLDLIGGHVEDGETPGEAMRREVAEELYDYRTSKPLFVEGFELFEVFDGPGGIEEHIFCYEAEFDIPDVRLEEGECLLWLWEADLADAKFAFGFGDVVARFFRSAFMEIASPAEGTRHPGTPGG